MFETKALNPTVVGNEVLEDISTTEIERPNITFYIYDKRDGKLHMRETKIYSPYNTKTKGYETDKFDFHDPLFVEFGRDGTFTLSVEEIGSEELYDQTKEWLSFYNPTGGRLSKGAGVQAIKNGKFFSAKKQPYYVTMEAPVEAGPKEVIVEKEVQINSIPRSFAETLNFTQLKALAKDWGINIPADIGKSGDKDIIKKEYLRLLSDHLSD